MTDVETAGWDAIDGALARVYPGQKPKHWGTLLKWSLGGPDPLDGVSVYQSERGAWPHWHFVSYGMSELYGKEADNAEWSGWGFEFSFRLSRAPGEKQPPVWPVNLLQNLGRYVFKTGNIFLPGDHMDLNGPISLERDTAIRAAFFALDPELGEIITPHGRLRFVQVVGATLEELDAGRAWNTEGMLEVMERRIPLLITDLARGSVVDDPECAGEVTRRTEIDGSSTGSLFQDVATWTISDDGVEVQIGAALVLQFKAVLRGRIPFGRGVMVSGAQRQVGFEPGAAVAWAQQDERTLIVRLPEASAMALADKLEPRQGGYAVGAVRIKVLPSYIRDLDGKVVKVIGE